MGSGTGGDRDAAGSAGSPGFRRLEKTEKASAQTACEMRELGDIVALERVEYFSPKIEDNYEDKSERNVVMAVVREGREQDHHEYDAGRAEERMGKKTGVKNAGYEAGDDDHERHGQRSVGFLEHRAKEQDIGEIIDEMVPVGVSGDMGEQAQVIERSQEVETQRVGNGEKGARKPVEYRAVHEDDERTKKGIGQGRRGVILYSHRSA